MEMKNKLYLHHKNKTSLFLRNFLFVSLGIFAVALAVAIPTYITLQRGERIPTLASEKEENSEVINVSVDSKLVNYR